MHSGALLGIWKMTETRNELLTFFPAALRGEADRHLEKIRSERRSIEWLSTRIMLIQLLGEEKIIQNREDGSPFLEDGGHFISISHTRGYAAVAISNSAPIGIDIEQRTDKVCRVREKFLSCE